MHLFKGNLQTTTFHLTLFASLFTVPSCIMFTDHTTHKNFSNNSLRQLRLLFRQINTHTFCRGKIVVISITLQSETVSINVPILHINGIAHRYLQMITEASIRVVLQKSIITVKTRVQKNWLSLNFVTITRRSVGCVRQLFISAIVIEISPQNKITEIYSHVLSIWASSVRFSRPCPLFANSSRRKRYWKCEAVVFFQSTPCWQRSPTTLSSGSLHCWNCNNVHHNYVELNKSYLTIIPSSVELPQSVTNT